MKYVATATRDEVRLRYRIFAVIVLSLLGVLALRLGQMQLLDREKYVVEAEGNAIQTNIVRPARGYIYDRNGVLLVDNETTLAIDVAPRQFDRGNLPLVAQLIGVPLAELEADYEENLSRSRYQTFTLRTNVPFAAFARLRENQYRLPGIGFEESQQRRYHGQARLAHVLGYVREIPEDELARREEEGYRLGDQVGRTGIEREYETILRGRVGRENVLVNVHGMEVQAYEGGAYDTPPESGVGLYLTIDDRVQALAESLFVNKRGGAVMIDVTNGEVISLVSAPDYDPSGFRGRMSQAFVDYTQRNPDQPLFNRATQSYQPPGSTFKPFMALVGLQEGLITEETTLYCGGGYFLGRLYRCHGGSHGNIAVRDAIRVSCNTFFFRVMNDHLLGGRRLDLRTWGNWAHRFGFGVLSPIDLPDQSRGLIPDSAYYDRAYPQGWTSGYTVNLGIGQGNMGVTPLQLARYTAAVANRGTLVTPHLIREQVNPETGERRRPVYPRATTIPIDARHWVTVQGGMEDVVTAGTGRGSRIEGITMAGKTGTAENPRGDDHAVFIAYAPADHPRVAVGVIVENAGFGATTAAPIASLMIEQFLRGHVERPDLVQTVRARRSGVDRGRVPG